MRNPRIHPASFLRRWLLLIAVAGAGGALAAYLYGTRATPTYEAEAQVLVQAGARQFAAIPTYAEIVRSTPVVAYALRSTGSPLSVEEVRANVRGEADRETRIITIRVVDTDRSRAVELANGLAAGLEWYVSAAAAATTSAAQATGETQIELIEPATSAARVRPLSSLLLEFGALAGVFGALAFALVVEARRSKVTNENDLVEVGGFPVLGSVNGAWPRMRTSLPDPTRSSPEEWGDYRRLATRITVASDGAAPRSLVLVGAEGAEASSAVGAKLALTLAQDGQRVVLADFEGDRIRRHFRIGARDGGAQLVKRSAPLTYRGTTLDRFALRSGAPLVLALPRQVSAGLNADDAENLVKLLSAEADLLIIHAPPPSRSRGALIWARATKATLLVVRAEYTKRADVEEAREGLEPVGTKMIGAVVQGGRP
jgi:capsular polysaccharide biosynthesis protein